MYIADGIKGRRGSCRATVGLASQSQRRVACPPRLLLTTLRAHAFHIFLLAKQVVMLCCCQILA